MSEQIDLVVLLVSISATILSIFALALSYQQTKSAKETLQLDAFVKYVEWWGTTEQREARKYVFSNFTDYSTSEDVDGQPIFLEINNEIKSVKVRELKNKEKENFEKVATGADRVGFVFLELELPTKFKKAYLEWLEDRLFHAWNKLAPHVRREREERKELFVPNFEKLAYLAYLNHSKENKVDRIVCLDHNTLEAMKKQYSKWFDC